jgi:hypothetical protein
MFHDLSVVSPFLLDLAQEKNCSTVCLFKHQPERARDGNANSPADPKTWAKRLVFLTARCKILMVAKPLPES